MSYYRGVACVGLPTCPVAAAAVVHDRIPLVGQTSCRMRRVGFVPRRKLHAVQLRTARAWGPLGREICCPELGRRTFFLLP